ncbi:MAG: D-alanyl-D-alanine endopeptidase [Betaproteobacteria bacterium]|nr:D-alanyl-D-alanine endopeptidase [Betaproteobacteria bacterium]
MQAKYFSSLIPESGKHFFIAFFAACAFGLAFSGGAAAVEKDPVQISAGKAPAKKASPPASSKHSVRAKKTGRSASRINQERSTLIKLDNRWETSRELVLQSGSAFVVAQKAGAAEAGSASEILFEKNAGTRQPIASITKLMTAMVVLDAVPNLKENIVISEEDFDSLRGSHSRLASGTQITREDALLLTLMSSENRAAHALARHYPGGVSSFVNAMNRKAETLGMNDTRFADPTGLSSNNTSTARDLARLVDAAYHYPLIREFTTTHEGTLVFEDQREIGFRNTNPLLKNDSWEIGLSKTGFIHEAGRCLVMQAYIAGKPVIIVLLDAIGSLSRAGDANRIKRWMEATRPGIQKTSDT